ncbi:hypothetical protein [Novosphingobium terrae]|uniref:hypothetical protein n=1 Tax=Novosphingobium terrae TaxID=2726189 RepID=UPI00197D0F9D|nr:hypothetical protein [Novosphingobium terrae]
MTCLQSLRLVLVSPDQISIGLCDFTHPRVIDQPIFVHDIEQPPIIRGLTHHMEDGFPQRRMLDVKRGISKLHEQHRAVEAQSSHKIHLENIRVPMHHRSEKIIPLIAPGCADRRCLVEEILDRICLRLIQMAER